MDPEDEIFDQFGECLDATFNDEGEDYYHNPYFVDDLEANIREDCYFYGGYVELILL